MGNKKYVQNLGRKSLVKPLLLGSIEFAIRPNVVP
jgi:hypothetical protein